MFNTSLISSSHWPDEQLARRTTNTHPIINPDFWLAVSGPFDYEVNVLCSRRCGLKVFKAKVKQGEATVLSRMDVSSPWKYFFYDIISTWHFKWLYETFSWSFFQLKIKVWHLLYAVHRTQYKVGRCESWIKKRLTFHKTKCPIRLAIGHKFSSGSTDAIFSNIWDNRFGKVS